MITEFDKALRLLDLEEYNEAEVLIKKAIKIAQDEEKEYELMGIYCCYGEVLSMINREEEAKIYLKKVIDFYEATWECEYEYNMAKELLDAIEEGFMS